MVDHRKVISSLGRRPISPLTMLPRTFRLPRGSRTGGRASPAMWDAIARARPGASFRRHSLDGAGDTASRIRSSHRRTRSTTAAPSRRRRATVLPTHFFMIPGMDHCGLPAQTGGASARQASTLDETARGYQPGVDGLRPRSARRADDIRSFDPSRELSKETPRDEREGLYCGRSCTRKSAGHCAGSSPLPVTLGQSA
jgi:hypothetical protein